MSFLMVDTVYMPSIQSNTLNVMHFTNLQELDLGKCCLKMTRTDILLVTLYDVWLTQ